MIAFEGAGVPGASWVDQTELRAAFARSLADMYGREVPAYVTLTEVVEQVNADVVGRGDDRAHRLGSVARIGAERHGAVRVGDERELREAGQVFAAMGMRPVGFYDLRDATRPVPVVSTAFRPTDPAELERNPFRVFTSVLVPQDRRFFDPHLQRRLEDVIGRRRLFPVELLELARCASADGGLAEGDARRFLRLATAAFELSPGPLEREWYESLARISSVAADIGGGTGTHVNHLTPRVLDIDALYGRMEERGIRMIDRIQGPPRWDGPDLLLRQTSFRALAERRRFRETDGTVSDGTLRVRFGEVESRGIAVTPAGRALYEELTRESEDAAAGGATEHAIVARELWNRRVPRTERELALADLAYFTVQPTDRVDDARARGDLPRDLAGLLDAGLVTLNPVVYEDFLPRSAAGIFASNLSGGGETSTTSNPAPRDQGWLASVLEADVADPFELYAAQRAQSVHRTADALGVAAGTLPWAA